MDWLNTYHIGGIVIGICTFLIIGIFHPIVIKAEYYWGTRCWWIFLILGIAGITGSVWIEDILISSLLGVFHSPHSGPSKNCSNNANEY